MKLLKFIFGFDLEKFREYYSSLDDLYRFYVSHGTREKDASFEIGEDELNYIKRNPNHLIVWKDNETIVGHCVWHETTTDEMKPGDPRDDEDRKLLESLFHGTKENLVELHEVWLRTEFRSRGYGNQFFDFFEKFANESGFDGIVYYTDNLDGIMICRKRGYGEEQEPPELGGWHVFAKTI